MASRSYNDGDLIEVYGTLLHQTPVAWLVSPDGTNEVWLPKSLVEFEPSETKSNHGTFTGPEWLMLEKGLI